MHPRTVTTADASTQLHVPLPFLTTVIVPIVGNAAEHASAVIFAVKNRMEISLGVAMGEHMRVVAESGRMHVRPNTFAHLPRVDLLFIPAL